VHRRRDPREVGGADGQDAAPAMPRSTCWRLTTPIQ